MNKLVALVLIVLSLALFAAAQDQEKIAEAYVECAGASAVTASVAVVLAFIAALL